MNPANIIYYLSRLSDVDLSLNVKQISETERLAAQQLAEIIRSIISINSNQIDHDNEVTLDFTIERDNCFIEDDFGSFHRNLPADPATTSKFVETFRVCREFFADHFGNKLF